MDHLYTGDVKLPDGFNNWFGWGEQTQTESELFALEQTTYEQAVARQPSLFTGKEEREWEPTLYGKFQEFMKSKGYDEGSFDMTLIDEFLFGRRMHWLPQDTGSCTISNTFRPWIRRVLAELMFKGQLEEPTGSTEFGPTSISFYAPLSYGIARQLGGLKGGDGGFCEETIKSLMMGVVLCNNGKLLEILNSLNAASEKDFPEPRSASVYRRFQNWTYNDVLKPFLTCPLVESEKITSPDALRERAKKLKPAIQCSSVAIKKGGEFKGLTFYVRDPNNSWAHNMSWQGFIIWQGRMFDLLSNESWGPNIIYPIPTESTEDIFRRNVTVQTLGELDLVNSTPLVW